MQSSDFASDFGRGFTPPVDRALGLERRTVVFAELIATAALIVSIVVVVTTVSLGMARADGVAGEHAEPRALTEPAG